MSWFGKKWMEFTNPQGFIDEFAERGAIPPEVGNDTKKFFQCYCAVCKSGISDEEVVYPIDDKEVFMYLSGFGYENQELVCQTCINRIIKEYTMAEENKKLALS